VTEPVAVAPEVAAAWGWRLDQIEPVVGGLINATHVVRDGGAPVAALQRLHPVFGAEVNYDLEAVTAHLAARGLETPRLIRTRDGRAWVDDGGHVWRALTWIAGETVPADLSAGVAAMSGWEAARRYFPTLLRASLVTIVLSCASMGLAVALGVLIATGRVYGGRPIRLALTGYVELMRGTPILLQLFVLYYGIAAAIRLPAFVAALLGLALNYAAYESEIYRSALEAVSIGQLDAARILGFSERQVLTLIRGPQAFRLALAPMTNDFVALLKDSSLVSVLTVFELTKQTQIFATNLGSWVIPGSLCAALYLAMSLPLAALARRLEQRWKAPTA